MGALAAKEATPPGPAPEANAGLSNDSFQKGPSRSKNGRLVPESDDSGNSWPTREKNGRLWQIGLCLSSQVE